MPARRKSTADLERSGAFRRNPARGRQRMAEPIVDGPIGPPPPDFCNPHSPSSIELLAAWTELVEEAKEVRLTSADRTLFIAACRLKVRTAKPSAKNADFGQLLAYLGRLGLTPADRSRVQGAGRKTAVEVDDEWAIMAAGGCPGMTPIPSRKRKAK